MVRCTECLAEVSMKPERARERERYLGGWAHSDCLRGAVKHYVDCIGGGIPAGRTQIALNEQSRRSGHKVRMEDVPTVGKRWICSCGAQGPPQPSPQAKESANEHRRWAVLNPRRRTDAVDHVRDRQG